MLRSIKELQGYTIDASDGEIGKLHEFFFDDNRWEIRYMVVDTGNWLKGRRVLVAPQAFGPVDRGAQRLPVTLSRAQVEQSPPVEADKPLSRRLEDALLAYYEWHQPHKTGARERVDTDLRSTREVIGYHIQARNGEIGHLDDMIVEEKGWLIRYLIIDTRNWLPGKKVLLPPAWAEAIRWAERKVLIDLKRETIEHSPEFDPDQPLDRDYEVRFYDYYDRPKYW
ncbi:MAG: PRC-barrel domain-containing protein [Chloroflexota bacterium]